MKCCLTVNPINRNFMIGLSVDPCQQMITVEIEELKIQLSLIDFAWNKEQEIFLKGIIRLRYVIISAFHYQCLNKFQRFLNRYFCSAASVNLNSDLWLHITKLKLIVDIKFSSAKPLVSNFLLPIKKNLYHLY